VDDVCHLGTKTDVTPPLKVRNVQICHLRKSSKAIDGATVSICIPEFETETENIQAFTKGRI